MTSTKVNIYTFFWQFLTLVVAFTASCGPEQRKRTDVPDVSGIVVDFNLLRFDRDLFALDTNQLETGMQQLGQKYPLMLPLFAVNIIHDATNPGETPLQAVESFLKAPELRHLYDTVQTMYGNLDWLEKELKPMFQYYKHYFPQKPQPEVVAMVSEYATDAFTYGDSLCGIGLDMFLGENYPGYNPEIFPSYIRRQFAREYITVRLAKALAQNQTGDATGQRLLDHMIHQGKILYITDCLLPYTPDSLKMGYTAVQMAGCWNNEQEIWGRILEQNLLYSVDFAKFRKMVTPSPNAPIIFEEAPGEVGSWMGWRIVDAYMKRHPGTTLTQLAAMNDAQKLLEASKYKPRRTAIK